MSKPIDRNPPTYSLDEEYGRYDETLEEIGARNRIRLAEMNENAIDFTSRLEPQFEAIIQQEDDVELENLLNQYSESRDLYGFYIKPSGRDIADYARKLDSVYGYKLAIKYGYDLNILDLEHACKNGSNDVVRFLLDNGVSANGESSGRPLSIAVRNLHIDVVDSLLEAGAVPEHEDGIDAVRKNRKDMVYRFFIAGLFPTDEMMSMAIDNANMNGDVDMVNVLYNIHPKINWEFRIIRSKNVARCYFENVFGYIPDSQKAISLLENQAECSSILLLAAPELIEDIADHMLTSVNPAFLNCILKAISVIEKNDMIILKATTGVACLGNNKLFPVWGRHNIPHGKVPGYDCPIFEAIAAGNKKAVEVIFNKYMHSLSNGRLTPVMLAVAKNNAEILTFLINNGASMRKVDNHSPMSVAIAYNAIPCAEILLEKFGKDILPEDLSNASREMLSLIRSLE